MSIIETRLKTIDDVSLTKYHEEIAVAIDKHTDETQVTYGQSFEYHMKVVFSDIEGIYSAIITDYIPLYIDFDPPTEDLFTSIIRDPDTGIVTFTFDPFKVMIDTTYVFTFRCAFNSSATVGDDFVNTAQLDLKETEIGPVQTHTSSASGVTLISSEIFSIYKKKILPTTATVAPGNTIAYAIVINNPLQETLTNLVIEDVFSGCSDISPLVDITFIKGEDSIDTDWNFEWTPPGPSTLIDVVSLSGNSLTLTFNVGTTVTQPYSGEKYQITIVGTVSNDITSTPCTITNSALYYKNDHLDPVVIPPVVTIVDIEDPSNVISKSGPETALNNIDNKISYGLSFSNNGNTDQTNVEVIDNIPPEVTINRFYVGTYGIPSLPSPNNTLPTTITVSYSTDNQSTFHSITSPAITEGAWIEVSDIIPTPDGDITDLKWVFSNWPVGASTLNGPRIDGIITSGSFEDTITNNVTMTLAPSTYKDTILNGEPVLDDSVKKSVSPTGTVEWGDNLTYTITFNTSASQIQTGYTVVLNDLLPPEVNFIPKTPRPYIQTGVNTTYDNYFSATPPYSSYSLTYDINVTIDPDTGQDLVTYTITNPDPIEQNSKISFQIPVEVKKGATEDVINDSMIEIYDSEDHLIDFSTSNQVVNTIDADSKLTGSKLVNGQAEDPEYYSRLGLTYKDGTLTYKIKMTNNGAFTLQTLELVDILPYIGDTRVMTNKARNSKFGVYITEAPTFEVISTDTNDPSTAVMTTSYSDSADPERFGPTNNEIGTQPWYATPQTSLQNVKSLKFTMESGTTLKPNDCVIITILAKVDIDADVGKIAWNSFAFTASYVEGTETITFLPVEPRNVGIKIVDPSEEIGSFTWVDLNKNGIYDEGEPLLPGVRVDLYIENTYPIPDQYVGTKTTDDNGQYLFNKLVRGIHYYLVFTPPQDYTYTKQVADPLEPDGSRPNPADGKTNLTEPTNLNMNAGFVLGGKIGDFTWIDVNNNGIYNPVEPPLPGVRVILYEADGTYVKETISIDTGYYLFDDLPFKSYYLEFIPPSGYTYTQQISDPDIPNGSRPNSQGITNTITLTVDEPENLDMDAGFINVCNCLETLYENSKTDWGYGKGIYIVNSAYKLSIAITNCKDKQDVSACIVGYSINSSKPIYICKNGVTKKGYNIVLTISVTVNTKYSNGGYKTDYYITYATIFVPDYVVYNCYNIEKYIKNVDVYRDCCINLLTVKILIDTSINFYS